MNLLLQNHETFPIKGRRQLNVELLSGTETIFSMHYDVPLHTARLESNGTRRVFMVYTEGKRMPKHVFKNEYGFDVGLIDPQATYNNYGCVQLYGNSFYYNLDFVATKFLSIYRIPDAPAQLTIKLDSYTTGINNLPDDYFNFLLAGVCWYLQLPVKAEVINTNILNTTATAIRV
ncbi:hypothetical protein FRZ67_07445 [Panacibacter ginsenosidivorans]|uniref:Uncharacterized protein n=1 Tax=Panacibacter ginsenosidivorans TaxID=1813871 RepID=A0A5B8V743_9BACT|nr:hypothetical protein [Panacibacter ginsenosidivorans]QEC67132.1 hypothetical protein FRZ67_07445 [Panacibacter ginsenosidivorans]